MESNDFQANIRLVQGDFPTLPLVPGKVGIRRDDEDAFGIRRGPFLQSKAFLQAGIFQVFLLQAPMRN